MLFGLSGVDTEPYDIQILADNVIIRFGDPIQKLYLVGVTTQAEKYGTVQLQLHFYTCVHSWHHAVFCVKVVYFFRGNTYLHVTKHGTSTL